MPIGRHAPGLADPGVLSRIHELSQQVNAKTHELYGGTRILESRIGTSASPLTVDEATQHLDELTKRLDGLLVEEDNITREQRAQDRAFERSQAGIA